jgi:hypothetical protein
LLLELLVSWRINLGGASSFWNLVEKQNLLEAPQTGPKSNKMKSNLLLF